MSCGCVMRRRRQTLQGEALDNESSGRKKKWKLQWISKKCDLSDILLLEDNSDEHDAAKLPGD